MQTHSTHLKRIAVPSSSCFDPYKEKAEIAAQLGAPSRREEMKRMEKEKDKGQDYSGSGKVHLLKIEECEC